MDQLPQHRTDSPGPSYEPPSLLVRAAILALAPVMLMIALPLLLLFVIAIYLLALVQGARVFVFKSASSDDPPAPEYQRPHFPDIEIQARSVPDQSHDS